MPALFAGGYVIVMSCYAKSYLTPQAWPAFGLAWLQTGYSAVFLIIHFAALYTTEARLALPNWEFAALFSIVSVLRWVSMQRIV